MSVDFAGPGSLVVPYFLETVTDDVSGVAPPGWEKSIKRMKKDKGIDNPFALCLSGETMIPCLDGQSVSVRDLAEREQDFWVYAFDQSQFMIVPGLARACYAGIKQAYELTLDNKEKIVCSGEHRWVLRDGAFVPTHSLHKGMSLMPFKTMYEKGGHERIYQPGLACYVLTHWSVMRVVNPGCTGGNFLIHHKNENPHDNQPDNLHWLSKAEHAEWHGQQTSRAMRLAWNDKFANDPDFGAGYVQRGHEQAKRMWDDPAYRERMSAMLRAQASRAGQKAAEVHRAKAEARRLVANDDIVSENHAIRKVIALDLLLPMYDIAVEGYHTFAITAGVYSHNSWWMKKRGAKPAKDEEAADTVFDAEVQGALAVLKAQGLPPMFAAAGRGETWAHVLLLDASAAPLLLEQR